MSRMMNLVLACCLLLGCEAPPPEQTKPAPTPAATGVSDQTWQRIKDCSAQAERIARPENTGQPRGSANWVWQSHYDAKKGRCYALLMSGPQKFLVDAYENREVVDRPLTAEGTECHALLYAVPRDDRPKLLSCAEADALIDKYLEVPEDE